jgi:hypothetical protein
MFKRHETKFDEYLRFQKCVQSKRGRFTKERKNRVDHISMMKTVFPDAQKVLCVGARHPSEVEDIESAGFEAIGIDLFSDSEKIMVLDMHKIGEMWSKNEFDVAYMSHSLEHSYDPGIVLAAVRTTCRMGAFVVLPMLAAPSRKETVVFDFMKLDDPTAEMIAEELEPLTGAVEIPWVKPSPRLKETVFPLVWK